MKTQLAKQTLVVGADRINIYHLQSHINFLRYTVAYTCGETAVRAKWLRGKYPIAFFLVTASYIANLIM